MKFDLLHYNLMKYRLGLKTRALKYASRIIQQEISPDKTEEEIYEELKQEGAYQYKYDNPKLCEFIENLNKNKRRL